MSQDLVEAVWKLFLEIRKEILEYQKIRSQVIGFKITFVSAGIGVIVANSDKISSTLLVVPAFAAIFFDFLITSYSFSVKRAGYYCQNHIEPIIRESYKWPKEYLLWEEFMRKREARQSFAMVGILGITVLSVAPAVYVLLMPFPGVSWLSWLTISMLIGFLLYDIKAFRLPRRFFETKEKKKQQRSNVASA